MCMESRKVAMRNLLAGPQRSVASGRETACHCRRHRDLGSIPGLGRLPGGGHGNPLQYSCLGMPRNRGAWWAMVHRVTKSWTWLKWLSTHAQWRCRHREQTWGHSGGRRGWDELREQYGSIYITIRKTDSKWEFAVWHRQGSSVLCDHLEPWVGVGGEKGVQEGGDLCIPVADSCWCMTGNSTTL